MISPTNSKILAIVFASSVALALTTDKVLIFLLATLCLVTLIQFLVQLILFKNKPVQEKDLATGEFHPMISVHIPICNEPPELVCETILSVVKQDYENFEVIVLDNNTSNPNLWEPVASYCNNFPNVQFIHRAKLEGFKAGALNLCRRLTSKKAEYIFTVDADYILNESCLSHAIRQAAKHSEVGLIQFPQAYWNVSDRTIGMEEEYKHYFSIYSEGSNKKNAVLGTGTLSLISISALDQIGGWPQTSITEDAQLGIQLQLNGIKTVYVNNCVGRGIMPLQLKDIRKQRLRWVFGNFQTLISTIKLLRSGATVPRESCLQLLAWINLCGLPIVILFAHSTLSALYLVEFSPLVAILSLTVFLQHFLFKFALFLKSTGFKIKTSFLALFTHLAMFEEGAFGWWEALVGAKKPFLRTNKFGGNHTMAGLPMLLPSLFFLCSACLFFLDQTHAGLVSILIAITFLLSGIFTSSQISHARQVFESKKIEL
jgi:cellulose synthase/poly-beta-1,6-N-acetylglucosamine synthase-like glycosyltransferase